MAAADGDASAPSGAPDRKRCGSEETGVSDERRFKLELEFVQCLANPAYLNWLAQQRYFEDPAFLNYLRYLRYWMRPEYCKFVIYPHALYFLDLLQRPDFRAAIADPSYKNLVHTQQLYFWQHWRTNQEIERAKERKEGEEAGRA